MRVLILRDTRPDAGLGHRMRMVALAEELASRECEILYAPSKHPAVDVVVYDDYRALAYRGAADGVPVVVIDDFGRDYPGAALVIRPTGEHALIRRRVRDVREGEIRTVGYMGQLDLRTRRDIAPDDVPVLMRQYRDGVMCGAGLSALEAAYLGVNYSMRVLAPNQQRTYDWLKGGGVPDGLGASRVARLIMDVANARR